jgi:hypothetical protein
MFGQFNRKSRQRFSVTLKEAYEIMPAERVVKIHDAVKFLGRDPRTVDSAIDLAISPDELTACASDYLLVPVVGTPQALFSYHAEKIATVAKAVRPTSARITDRALTPVRSVYRLIRSAPLADTFGKDPLEQERILAKFMLPEKIAGGHAAAFTTLVVYHLLGIDITQGRLLRTSDKMGEMAHVGFALISGKLSFDYVNRTAQSSVGAFSEVVL